MGGGVYTHSHICNIHKEMIIRRKKDKRKWRVEQLLPTESL